MKIGDRVLSYIIESELGEGGMGTVFLGRHTVLNQQVAIKALSPLLSRDQALRERFTQEANIQAGLRHPGIVQVLTAEMEGEQPSLVMEYIDGKSLSEVLELRGSLPVDDAVKIMEQVLSAVGYAHKRSVIHRDLKPSNVMVMASGETKVTDFGIAKVLGSVKLTRTGTAMGSAHYMSPEQVRRPEAVDARSDIYSLGCVFYEVLTGHPPFGKKDASETESDYEIKTAHVTEAAPALETVKSGIPAWLAKLVMSMLEKEPDQRQSSCEEIVELLKAGDTVDIRQSQKTTGKFGAGQAKTKEKQLARLGDRNVNSMAAVTVLGLVFGSFLFYVASITLDQQVSDHKAEQIEQKTENLVKKIEAGNPNGLVQCPKDQGSSFHNCWGTVTSYDGNKYVGEFKDGDKHGLGTYTWPDSEKYVGEWSNGKRSGQGTQTKADGEKYIGEYENDFFHGLGIKYALNGTVIESGIYEYGKLVKTQLIK